MARTNIKQAGTTKLKWALAVIGGCFLIFWVVSAVLMAAFWAKHHSEPEVIGVSFSQKQAERYGVDWRANYTALLSELGFKHLRVAAYWDRIEPSQDQFDFSELDWMVAEAAKYDAKLTVVVGQKNIRYPECYYPDWLDRNNQVEAGKRAKAMVTKTVQHLKGNAAIEAWQVENEFLLRSFGECPSDNLNRQQLKDEIAIVRTLDPSRPIVLTQSDQFGFPTFGPFGDFFGFSMYRWSYREDFGYFRYPQPGAYNWFKAAWVEALTAQQVKVHELQAEAWGKTGNEYLPLEEQFKTMNPAQLRDNIQYARDTQIRRFDLWGAEWWYWLKVSKGQPAMWDEVKALIGN